MIHLQNVTKAFRTPRGTLNYVADDITVTLPGRVSIGLLGRNGAGKSTLMRMIGGSLKPDSGTITRTGTISWPVGFSGSFHGQMTGAQNTRFIARAYGVDTDELLTFVEEFAELGPYFHSPVRQYSSGMKSRLAFGVSIGIPFDTYLVDEVTSVGDASFKRKSRFAFINRMGTSGALVVTHSTRQLRNLCQSGLLLEGGKLQFYEDIEDAIKQHQINMGTDEDE